MLRELRPSHVQAWLGGLISNGMASNYVNALSGTLSSVLGAALDDGLILRNPVLAKSVRPPKRTPARVEPWTAERVQAVIRALPGWNACMAVIGAGLGLRQGEIFGLGVEDIDFLRGVLHVRRQVRLFKSRRVFSPPKGGKERDVPLPPKIGQVLAAHLKAYPAQSVTLPWRTLDGQPAAVQLVFTAENGTAYQRTHFNENVWKPALARAGVIPKREKGKRYAAAGKDGMHALRHHYASVLLDAGESIKALALYLGHSDPGFTLRTYTHLMPSSEERTKKAIDGALGATIDSLISGPSAPVVPSGDSQTS